jgi:hypothetical protein
VRAAEHESCTEIRNLIGRPATWSVLVRAQSTMGMTGRAECRLDSGEFSLV